MTSPSTRLQKILSQLSSSHEIDNDKPVTQKRNQNTHQKRPLRLCITGAAGQIAYALYPLILTGKIFGRRKIFLHLVEVESMMNRLEGVVMELRDCAYECLGDVLITCDLEVGFLDVDFCVMLGAFPRKDGMLRKDLLSRNADIFRVQGEVLNRVASRDVKVLVVGNPANTNCWICSKYAPDIPKENFSSLTRLDQNRSVGQLARKLGVNPEHIKNTIIWGNHSNTQVPDISKAVLLGRTNISVLSMLEQDYIRSEFIPCIQNRGAQIIKQRGLGSSLSAAKAISDHLYDWYFGTAPGEWVSMGVVSDGSYGIEKDLIFSFPVVIRNGKYHIVQNLSLDSFTNEMITRTMGELIEERDFAETI